MGCLATVVNFDTNASFSRFLVELLTPDYRRINLLQFLSNLPLLNIRVSQSCNSPVVSFANQDHCGVTGAHAVGKSDGSSSDVTQVSICLAFEQVIFPRHLFFLHSEISSRQWLIC